MSSKQLRHEDFVSEDRELKNNFVSVQEGSHLLVLCVQWFVSVPLIIKRAKPGLHIQGT